MRRHLAAVPLLALLATACGGGAAVRPRAPAGPWQPDELVLSLSISGEMAPPAVVFGTVNGVFVYGDGRVVVPGAIPSIYPGPALRPLLVGRIDPALLPGLVADARAAGVDGEERDHGRPAVEDATTVTFTADGERVAVYAIEPHFDEGLTAEQRAARAALRRWGDDLMARGNGAEGAYEPVAIGVRPGAPPAEPGQATTWRGPAPSPCVVLRGAELAAVAEDVRKAKENTTWLVEGRPAPLAFRPLLPHERECRDLPASA